MGISFSSFRSERDIHAVVDRGTVLPWVGAFRMTCESGTGDRDEIWSAANRVSVPADPAARRRFLRDWVARNRAAIAAGFGGMVLLLPMMAQAAGEVSLVQSLPGLVGASRQADGSVVLRFDDGSTLSVPADQLEVQADGRIIISQEVIADLMAEAGGTAGPDLAGLALGGGLALGIAAVAGSSGGGGGAMLSPPPAAPGLVTGPGTPAPGPVPAQMIPVIDGYLVDAFVFRDLNANGIWDSGEVYTTTDASGAFDVNLLTGQGGLVAGTPSAAAIAQDAGLAALRPIDLSTGQPFTGTLTAPDGASVVTPLTTLIDSLLRSDAGLTAGQAADQVAQALGLNGDLLADDPVALAEAGGAGSLAQLQAAAQLAAIINVTTAAGGNAAAAITALAQQIGADADGVVSLADPVVLDAVLGASVAPGQAAALSQVLTQVNDALRSGGDLADIEQVQGAVQGAIVDAVEAGETVDVAQTIADSTPLRPVITTAPKAVNAADAAAGITISGTGRAGSDVSVSFGDLVETAEVNSLGAWSVTFADVPTDGAQQISARASVDGGPLGSASAALTVSVDATAPAAPAVALVSDTGTGAGITANGAVTLTGVEAGASVSYSTDGGATWAASFTAAEGANTLQVRQTDAAGNVSQASAPLSFTLDTVAPVITLSDPLPARIDAAEVAALEGGPALIDGSVAGVAAGTQVTLALGSRSYEAVTTEAGGFQFSVPFADILALEGTGSVAMVIAATDPAGNTGTFEAELPVVGDLDGSDTVDLVAGIQAADTLVEMEAALQAFAAAREIALPEGMVTALAGDLLLAAPASYRLTFDAQSLDASGTLADGAPETISGSMTFSLPLQRADDQLRDATQPVGIFQHQQDQAEAGNMLNVPIEGLRLNATSLRMDPDVVTQQDIDDLGPDGIAALFGPGVVIEPGVYTSLQVWLSGAVGSQDPVTGEFTISGAEASINMFLPGEVGLEAFIDALARDALPLKQFQILDVDGTVPEGTDDIVGEILASFQSFSLVRSPAPLTEADVIDTLNGFIAIRTSLDTVLDAANAGTLAADDLAALAAVLPVTDGAAPFLAGEQLSVADIEAIAALASLPAAELDPLLAAFNGASGGGVLDRLTDLADSPILFPPQGAAPGDGGGGALPGDPAEGLPASVLAALDGQSIAGWTGEQRSGVNLVRVDVAGDEALGHEHWFVVDGGPGNAVIADFAFSQGEDRYLRGVESADDAFYFQVLSLTVEPGGFAQDPADAVSVYRLDFDAVVPALQAAAASQTGGADAMVAFVSGVSVLSLGWASVGYADLPVNTVLAVNAAGFVDEGGGSYRVAASVLEYAIETDTVGDNSLYLTPVLDVNGTATPGTGPYALSVPGRLTSAESDSELGLLTTFEIGEGDAARVVTYQIDLLPDGSPVLGDEVVRGTEGNDDLFAVTGMGLDDAGTLVLPSSGEDTIALTGSTAADTIFYRAGFTDGPDLVTGFDTGADRIGYAVTGSETPSLSLTTVAAASSADADLIAALETYTFGTEDVQFVLLDPAQGDGPLLLAMTQELSAGEPAALATLEGISAASFTLDNLLVVAIPSPEV